MDADFLCTALSCCVIVDRIIKKKMDDNAKEDLDALIVAVEVSMNTGSFTRLYRKSHIGFDHYEQMELVRDVIEKMSIDPRILLTRLKAARQYNLVGESQRMVCSFLSSMQGWSLSKHNAGRCC